VPTKKSAPKKRGAQEPGNKTGVRKQGGPKAGRKSTGIRASSTARKRSGSESGGGKTKKKSR
jgi:hypothetical protein